MNSQPFRAHKAALVLLAVNVITAAATFKAIEIITGSGAAALIVAAAAVSLSVKLSKRPYLSYVSDTGEQHSQPDENGN